MCILWVPISLDALSISVECNSAIGAFSPHFTNAHHFYQLKAMLTER